MTTRTKRIRTVADMTRILAHSPEHTAQFAIILAGGLCYSRKVIRGLTPARFSIYHAIDEHREVCTASQLEDACRSNIALAMKRGTFVHLIEHA